MMSLRLIQRFGRLLSVFAGLYAIAALLCLGLIEIRAAFVFLSLAVVIGLIGFIFIISSTYRANNETNIDALMFLVLFWIISPILSALPFALIMPNMTLSGLVFEGVGSVTTSGASGFLPSELPNSLHIWRGIVQFFGGVIVATFAIVILATLNLTGSGIHRSLLFTQQHEDIYARVVYIGRIVAMAYGGLAAFAFIILLMAGASPVQGFCLALGGVSTSGLSPVDGPLASIISPFGAFLFALICLFGALNFAIIWDVIRLRNLRSLIRIITNVEHRAMLVMTGILFIVSGLYFGGANLKDSAIEALFFISTAGYDYNIIALEMMPPIILIAFALVGGSALSTAGGLKVIRVLLLFRHLETDLSRLSHPSRVYPVRFRGRLIDDRAFLSIWMYFFGYTCIFGFGIIAFAASGIEFETSVSLSAAMISNMAPLVPYTFSDMTLIQLSDAQKLIASALMFIGRVEVLAIFAILSARPWRN